MDAVSDAFSHLDDKAGNWKDDCSKANVYSGDYEASERTQLPVELLFCFDNVHGIGR